MGRNVSIGRAALAQIKDKKTLQLENKLLDLEKKFLLLAKNQGRDSWTEVNTSQCKYDKNMKKCDLLDWQGNEEIVAEGRVVSDDPKKLVNNVPLGPAAMIILIDCPEKPDAFLWRPTTAFRLIGEATDNVVAWPTNRVVLRSSDHIEEEEDVSGTGNVECKCKIFDWGGSKQLVAIGRLHSSISEEIVNDVPLGPSAMIVWIDNPQNIDAFLWRPSPGMTRIADAVGKKVAWPESQVVVEKATASTTPVTTMQTLQTFMTANSRTNNRCKLLDLSGKGKVVALGCVESTNPNARVHFKPLGNNAVSVWIDIVKEPTEELWRQTSELQYMEDALCSIIAWPAALVIME